MINKYYWQWDEGWAEIWHNQGVWGYQVNACGHHICQNEESRAMAAAGILEFAQNKMKLPIELDSWLQRHAMASLINECPEEFLVMSYKAVMAYLDAIIFGGKRE